MPENLPSNSYKAKSEAAANAAAQKKKVDGVVKGKVKKKTSFHELFLSEDSVRDIGEYVVKEIAVPRLKDLLFDMTIGALSRRLYGVTKPMLGANNILINKNGVTKVNYGAMSTATTKASQLAAQQAPSKNDLDVSSIVFEDKSDADLVLAGLCDIVSDYGKASVADFYSLAQMDWDWTLQNWGWTKDAVVQAKIMPTRGGYYMEIIRPGALGK